jgi:carboxyl-terminal processing protease
LLAVVRSVFAVWILAPLLLAGPKDGAGSHDLAPAARHSATLALVVQTVEGQYYQDVALDDGLSARILDTYLGRLDSRRDVFLAGDIAGFERYRLGLDEALREARPGPAFEIFHRYLRRLETRIHHALGLLDRALDLSRDERHVLDRDQPPPWAADAKALDELWRRRVKHDVLTLKVEGLDGEEIRTVLRTRYRGLLKRATGLDSDAVFAGFINAYLHSLDPHCGYFLPHRARRSGQGAPKTGIGVQLMLDGDYVAIRRVFSGGAAQRSGALHRGDRIIGVAQGENGPMVDIVGWTLEDAVALIRGPAGSVLRLRVLPRGAPWQGPTTTLTLTRAGIKLQGLSPSRRVIQVRGAARPFRVGVIQVPRFHLDYGGLGRGAVNTAGTPRQVEGLIRALRSEGVDGLIVDLRGNPGGALLAATALAGLFIESGPGVFGPNRRKSAVAIDACIDRQWLLRMVVGDLLYKSNNYGH